MPHISSISNSSEHSISSLKSKRIAIRMRRKEDILPEKISPIKAWHDSTSTAVTMNASSESLAFPGEDSNNLDTPSMHLAREQHIQSIRQVLRKVSSVDDECTPCTTPKGKKKLRVTSATAQALWADDDTKTPSTPRRNLVQSLKERFSNNIEATPKNGKKQLRVSTSAAQAMLAAQEDNNKSATGTPVTPRRKLVRSLKDRFARKSCTLDHSSDEAPSTPRSQKRQGLTRESSWAAHELTTEFMIGASPLESPCTPKQQQQRRGSNGSVVSCITDAFTRSPLHRQRSAATLEGEATSIEFILSDLPLETPCSTPRRNPGRRGSNGSFVDNIKEVFTRTPRRDSANATSTLGNTTPRAKKAPPKKSCQDSSTFHFVGNMSFGNVSISTLPFGNSNHRPAPYGKEMIDYAENSTGELSQVESLDSDFEFNQGTVSMETAHELNKQIQQEIQLHTNHKENILKNCARDWELAQARKEAGNRLGFLTTIRKMHIRRMQVCKHEEALRFLETLKLVVQSEINQATCLAQLTNMEAALLMPITKQGLKEELEYMLSDWEENIDVDEMNVKEYDDIPDFEEELFRELLLKVPVHEAT